MLELLVGIISRPLVSLVRPEALVYVPFPEVGFPWGKLPLPGVSVRTWTPAGHSSVLAGPAAMKRMVAPGYILTALFLLLFTMLPALEMAESASTFLTTRP